MSSRDYNRGCSARYNSQYINSICDVYLSNLYDRISISCGASLMIASVTGGIAEYDEAQTETVIYLGFSLSNKQLSTTS